MNDQPDSDGTRVVIAGGGVAGIEALLALHDLAGDRVSLTLVAPQPDFVYKPLLVVVHAATARSGGALLGSVSGKLMRLAPCPVLVLAREAGEDPLGSGVLTGKTH